MTRFMRHRKMAEDRLLEILKNCHDLGSMSMELLGEIVDLTTRFHFDPTRANVLRPFPFGPEDSVLEVGAGCVALTRWLAEQGASRPDYEWLREVD